MRCVHESERLLLQLARARHDLGEIRSQLRDGGHLRAARLEQLRLGVAEIALELRDLLLRLREALLHPLGVAHLPRSRLGEERGRARVLRPRRLHEVADLLPQHANIGAERGELVVYHAG